MINSNNSDEYFNSNDGTYLQVYFYNTGIFDTDDLHN